MQLTVAAALTTPLGCIAFATKLSRIGSALTFAFTAHLVCKTVIKKSIALARKGNAISRKARVSLRCCDPVEVELLAPATQAASLCAEINGFATNVTT